MSLSRRPGRRSTIPKGRLGPGRQRPARVRTDCGPIYYAAFLIDLDGTKVEAVWMWWAPDGHPVAAATRTG